VGKPAVGAVSSSEVTGPATDASFSFQAVTESANALGTTTEKLQRLLRDLRAFIEGGSLSTETSTIDGHITPRT
jgi:hypothetical protein